MDDLSSASGTTVHIDGHAQLRAWKAWWASETVQDIMRIYYERRGDWIVKFTNNKFLTQKI